jgi:hypothetical protein
MFFGGKIIIKKWAGVIMFLTKVRSRERVVKIIVTGQKPVNDPASAKIFEHRRTNIKFLQIFP